MQKIETSLEKDPGFSAAEKIQVRLLKVGVSDIIVALNRGVNPHLRLATAPLLALEWSVRQRTIGERGFPLA